MHLLDQNYFQNLTIWVDETLPSSQYFFAAGIESVCFNKKFLPNVTEYVKKGRTLVEVLDMDSFQP